MEESVSRDKSLYRQFKNEQQNRRNSENRDTIRARSKKFYQDNREKIRKHQNEFQKTAECKLRRNLYMSKWSAKNRQDLVNLLGGKCTACGATDFRILQLDHKRGRGIDDLKKFGRSVTMYRYYLKNPEIARRELQVLCANDNIIKRYENGEIRKYFDVSVVT